ncbi:vesicle-associated protein 1-3-like isoform X2 [Musa acuminata AAA Group]|uniref:vesicle-associated protein 1-3-like isoform X2 n=1 Tax=Musa acuminata AAA Group TaxID=214697 RepID=UPI0031CE0470
MSQGELNDGGLLDIQPSELRFAFELKKQSLCSFQLTNKTDQCVAFKVKTTNPKKYCVRPNAGIISPKSSCDVTVTMQAQKEAPHDMQCKDKFLLQSVITEHGVATTDITAEMFNREPGKLVEEFKLRVTYVMASPPSPVSEEQQEGSSPRSSTFEDGAQSLQTQDSAFAMILKLTEEKNNAIAQNQKLQQEVDLLNSEVNRHHMFFVVVGAVLAALIGYIIKKSYY